MSTEGKLLYSWTPVVRWQHINHRCSSGSNRNSWTTTPTKLLLPKTNLLQLFPPTTAGWPLRWIYKRRISYLFIYIVCLLLYRAYLCYCSKIKIKIEGALLIKRHKSSSKVTGESILKIIPSFCWRLQQFYFVIVSWRVWNSFIFSYLLKLGWSTLLFPFPACAATHSLMSYLRWFHIVNTPDPGSKQQAGQKELGNRQVDMLEDQGWPSL